VARGDRVPPRATGLRHLTDLRRALGSVAVVALLAATAACGGATGGDGGASRGASGGDASAGAVAPVTPSPTNTPVVPTALGTTVPPPAPAAAIPTFEASTQAVTAADLGASWHEGCPVGPEQLRRVTLRHWGFDDQVHTGVLIVHVDAVDSITKAFASLFAQRFAIRNMEPVDRYGASDDASMDVDNTSAFNCRLAVTSGPASWSVHAFGQAIDINPRENPYLEGGRVLPPAGRDYLNRADVRPGMAVAGGPLVQAFADVGWYWGGRPGGFSDYQHFSATGG
jgi:hypothetical protein